MTRIEWTDVVWNPTTGCDKVSPGCGMPRFDGDLPGGCYAMAMAKRLKGMRQAKYQTDGDPKTSGPGFGVAVHPDALDIPLRWRKPRRIFVNSMSDLFHESVPDNFIGSVFDTMALAPQHTFQILTKRHARMRSLLTRWQEQAADSRHAGASFRRHDMCWCEPSVWPLPNVWLGVSVEDQKWADIRIPALLQTPAAVRFLSCEPLLGPLDIRHHLGGFCPEHDFPGGFCVDRFHPGVQRIGWTIIGGESGPGARPMEIEWARTLVRHCRDWDVAPFVKQLGAIRGRELGAGSHGGDWDAWPEDLRIREFPRTPVAVA